METPSVETVFDSIRAGKAPANFENPPVLSDEEKKKHAIQEATRLDIIRRANEYVKTPVADRAGKKHLLREIQEIVDMLDDAFVLMVYDKAGVPTCITFNPHTPEPVDPTIPENSLDTPES